MEFVDLASKVMDGEYLSSKELEFFVKEMRLGNITDLQFVSFLSALETRNRIKGISKLESSDFVSALKIKASESIEGILCNSGTGGDRVKTINVSTPASIIISAGGIKVLKNGSKRLSGYTGSKEIFEYFGINTSKEIKEVLNEVKNVGIGYYDFSKLVPIKSRSGLRSPLNLLGPLCNPINLEYKILGCVDEKYARTIEPILNNLAKNYIIICNENIDEISTVEKSLIIEKRKGERKEYLYDPRKEEFYCKSYTPLLHPKDLEKSGELILRALEGKEGEIQDLISLNAGLGFYLSEKTNSIKEGFQMSKRIIQSGEAITKLNAWRNYQKNE
jgi:anthranilate phosphoribosyltransferase